MSKLPLVQGSPDIPDKLYFRIGEVSRLIGVKQYVLRYWESEFPGLGPKKSGTGHRLYRRGQEGDTFHIIAQGEVEVFRDGQRVARLGAGTSVGEMAYLAPSPDLRRHSADIIVSEPCTTISFTPETLTQLSAESRMRFDKAFIQVLVRRLHAAHETLAHPRRVL